MTHVGPVALVELEAAGHRLRYVRLLHDRLDPADRLVVLSAAARASPEWAEHLAGTEDVTATVDAPGRRALVDAALAHAAARDARLVVVPDGDKNVAALLRSALRRSRSAPPLSVLLMRTALPGGPERATLGMALKPALVALLRRRRGVRVHFLTDAFGVVTRRRGFPGVTGVRDPVEVPVPGEGTRPAGDPVPTRWATAAGTRRVGVLGVVGARKNVPLLVEVAAADPSVAVVVAGRCDPPVRTFLDTDARARALAAQDRLVVDDRLLDAAEFDAALRSLDAVAVLHDNDAPSGIVAEAAARGVPVLGPDRGWVSEVLRATGIGRTAPVGPGSAAAVGAALAALLADHDRHVAATDTVRARLGVEDFTVGLLGDAA